MEHRSEQKQIRNAFIISLTVGLIYLSITGNAVVFCCVMLLVYAIIFTLLARLKWKRIKHEFKNMR